MVIVQSKSKRSSTGGRYRSARKKRKFEIGRSPSLTKVDETRSKKIVTKGKGVKTRLLKANVANLFDPKTKTYSKVKIASLRELASFWGVQYHVQTCHETRVGKTLSTPHFL